MELLEPLANGFRAGRIQLRQVGRDDAAVEPVLRAAGLSHQAEVSRRFRPGDLFLRWRDGSAQSALVLSLQDLGQNGVLSAVGQGLGWRSGLAERSDLVCIAQNLALAPTLTEDVRFSNRTDPAVLVRKHGRKSEEEISLNSS